MWRLVYTICILSFINFHCKKDNGTDVNNNSGNNATPVSYNHNLNPGSSAKDFLRSTVYKSLKIEFQYMPGQQPESGAIILLQNFLQERLNKPNGITIELKEIYPTLITYFSLSDLNNIEDKNRTAYTNGEQLTAYVLIVDGCYYSSNALALSYHNTSICLFGEPLQYYSIGSNVDAKAKTWAMILEHEFCHLLGLVNLGTFMVSAHEDEMNTGHCINYNCLLHHTFETYSRVFSRDQEEIPLPDANCLADLRANGGK